MDPVSPELSPLMQAPIKVSREYSKSEWAVLFAVAMANTGLEVPLVGIPPQTVRNHMHLFDIFGMEVIQDKRGAVVRQRPMFRH